MEKTDERLAERLAKQEPTALNALMDAYGSAVYHHLVRRILSIE